MDIDELKSEIEDAYLEYDDLEELYSWISIILDAMKEDARREN